MMRMDFPKAARRWSAAAVLTTVGLAAGAAVLSFGPGVAQESPARAALVAEGLEIWRGDAGCFNCHGNFGEGGEGGHFPAGPSLRRTQLPAEGLRLTIACGRPGTEMPYNLAGAYTEVACYSFPVPTDPATIAATPGVAFTPEQIDALTAYIVDELVGKGNVTRDQCAAFYGGNRDHPDCNWR